MKVLESYKKLEFVRKYDDTGCLKTHLKYYSEKMTRYSDNVSLLINTFQNSLVELALSWFIELDFEQIHEWENLTDEFLQQYKFNSY